jgi:acylphosphatase
MITERFVIAKRKQVPGIARSQATFMNDTIAILVHYSGRVQGVGFRVTTASIARSFQVAGWVKNLRDGRVEVHVEGSESEVQSFLAAVRSRWRRHLTDEQSQPQEPTGLFRSFEVLM